MEENEDEEKIKKARICVYDDYCIIDDTDVLYKNLEQVSQIAISMLKATPDAQYAEVYNCKTNRLMQKYKITSRGAVTKTSLHPTWGGKRDGAGRKKKGKLPLNDEIIHFRVDKEMYEFLTTMLSKKAEYIRTAIREKREREEQNNINNQALPQHGEADKK